MPWLPSSQLQRSRDAHLASCAPDLTPEQNRIILRNGTAAVDISYRVATRKKTGWHSAEWRKERIQKAKSQGHELSCFVPDSGLLKNQFLRYTCRHCKRVQGETDCFTRNKCIKRKYPKTHIWRKVRLTHDQFVGPLVKIWGWGQQQVKDMDALTNSVGANPRLKQKPVQAKLPNPGSKAWFKNLPADTGQQQKPVSKAKNWQRDLCAEGVEPNPGPRAHRRRLTKLRICSVNIAGKENLWSALPHLKPKEFDVVCLQEANMSDVEIKVLAAAAWKSGWVTFALSNKCCRGMITMVGKHMKSRIAHQLDTSGGQLLGVQVGHMWVGNVYCAHHPEREAFMTEAFQLCHSWSPNVWTLVGDFNDTPEESPLAFGLTSSGYSSCLPPPGVSSRWESQRVIDFAICNGIILDSTLKMCPERYSDHKAFYFDVKAEGADGALTKVVMVPANVYLPQDTDRGIDWTERLADAWQQNRQVWQEFKVKAEQEIREADNMSEAVKQHKSDRIWDHLNLLLETFVQKQAQWAQEHELPMRPYRKAKRAKGSIPTFRHVPLVIHQPHAPNASNQLRTWMRLWGRLSEAERRQHHDNTVENSKDLQKLWKRIRRCPLYQAGMTAKDAETEVQRQTEASRQSRLSNWKVRLQQDNAQVFRWVRSSESAPTVTLYDDEVDPDDPASMDSSGALVKIESFWQRAWNRDNSDAWTPQQYLREYGGAPEVEENWSHVSAQALSAPAARQRHRAGGPDGWTGSEMAAWPYNMWADLEFVFQAWEQLGCFPKCWHFMTQVMLPKGNGQRLSDSATPTSKLRPISLMSCWWRIYVSARLDGDIERRWLESHLLTTQAGGRRNRDSQGSFCELAEGFAKGAYVGSLDLSKCFDHVRPSLACDTLVWKGFPRKLAAAIQKIWEGQLRILSWNKEVCPRIQGVRSSIPQGDSLSPRVLNLIMSMPMRHIVQQEPDTCHVVFVDDRSWCSPTLPSFLNVLHLWHEHSAKLGFKENKLKSQFTHRQPTKRQDMMQLEELCNGVTENLFALGAAMGFGSMLPKEQGRIEKAMACAAKVRLAPISAARRSFVGALAAGSKATYGWLVRAPPGTGLMSKLETRLRRVGYCHRMSSPALIRLVMGHPVDIQFQSGAALIGAVHRTVRRIRRIFSDWDLSGGPAQRAKKWLQSLGWSSVVPWVWQHPAFHFKLSLNPSSEDWSDDSEWIAHLLREAWRWHWWQKYMASQRHELVEFGDREYPKLLLENTRKMTSGANKNVIAVLTGAFVSPQMRTKQADDVQEKCPWCDGCGHFHHVAWECQNSPQARSRPVIPQDPLMRRFGWGDNQVVQHLAACRDLLLRCRYGGN